MEHSTNGTAQGRSRMMRTTIGVIVVLIQSGQIPSKASSTTLLNSREAVEAIADRLEALQIKYGVGVGSWPREASFTGSTVAGMVGAYELTCEDSYRDSAELGGDFILNEPLQNLYGDEAFALMRLSQIDPDPYGNIWRTVLENFYFNVKHDIGGTQAYISGYAGTEPSTAVFYLANHVVAAYYVDANDRALWRQGLIDWLAEVDDSISFYPVMAVGVATWALSLTGELDDMLIDPSGEGSPYWNLRKLSDLPDILLSHQVPQGQPYQGSFYYRFDHAGDSSGSRVSGYTEDAIFATLGLAAASQSDPGLNCETSIAAARAALLGGVTCSGTILEHLSKWGTSYYVYGGEMLQVLGEVVFEGDLNLDDSVDFSDYAEFAECWQSPGCRPVCSACWTADLDGDGDVDFADFETIADNWLAVTN